MSEKTLTGKEAVKRVLPILIGLVLIVLVAVIAVNAKSCGDKRSTLSNGDQIYMDFDKLKITNDRLYTVLKQTYGVSELVRLMDEKLFAKELQNIDNAELMKFIYNSLYEVEDINDFVGDPQEEWDEIIDSLLINNLLTKAEAAQSDVTNTDSAVWVKVREFYKLQFVRTEWAKEEFKKRYLKEREDNDKEGMFDEEDIEDYYEENYGKKYHGFFIPFTSEAAAYKMMKKYGIHTNSNVLNENGWVSSSYDYNNESKVPEEKFLNSLEVMDAFIAMYNEVFSYLNEGNPIITPDKYNAVDDITRTLTLASKKVGEKVSSVQNVLGNLTLVNEVVLDDGQKVKIEWSLEENSYLKIDENDNSKINFVTNPEQSQSELSIKLYAKFTYGDDNEAESFNTNYTLKVKHVSEDKRDDTVSITVDPVTKVQKYEFNEDFLTDTGIDFSKLIWDVESLSEVSSTLKDRMSSSLVITNDLDTFYRSYTVKPISMGNYYILIIKFNEEAAPTLEDVKDEIIEKMAEELVTENDITKMIYTYRRESGLEIYDHYLEAVYEYQYTYFFETTISEKNYTKFKKSKKKNPSYAASVLVDGKREYLTADVLFDNLQNKYGVSTCVDLLTQYRIVSNSDYNSIYNPYTNTILNKKVLKDLLNTEISNFRKNFELDYFTYSYLAYYGFIPNFPASYGWNNFKKDYFGAYSDEELLVSSAFGGTVYNDAYTRYTESLYIEDDINNAMDELFKKYFKVDVLNLIVYVDYDYNSELDSNVIGQKDEDKTGENVEVANWTDEQRALVDELTDLLYNKAVETGKVGLSAQMTEIVKLYNEASLDIPTGNGDGKSIYEYNFFAKYKKAGLYVKFEASATYDSASEIVEEFADELRVLYHKIVDLDLLDAALDVPLINEKAFETTFGYHRIAVTKGYKATRMPTAEEIEIYNLLKEVEANKDSKVEYLKAKYDAAVKRLEEILGDEYDKDYAMDEEAKAAVEAWYTKGKENVLSEKLLTSEIIKYLEENMSNINFTGEDRKGLLDTLIEISKKDLEDEETE